MTQIKTLDPQALSQRDLHRYLLGAVAPRPICFASTIDREGNVNLSPFSFFNVFSSNPPIMIFSPARSGRDGSNKHSLENVMEVHEVVINIVNYPMVEQMSLASTPYDKGVNEFTKAGFTEVSSEKVAPPRVGQAPVAFECKVNQVIELGQEGGAGNLVVSEVLLIHIDEEYLDEKGFLDTEKLDLVARMGGSWYCRATGEALFQIPKPSREKGMGIDRLPAEIRNSAFLTGNELGRLGGLPKVPTDQEIEDILKEKALFQIQANYRGVALSKEIHLLAKKWIQDGEAAKALAALLAFYRNSA